MISIYLFVFIISRRELGLSVPSGGFRGGSRGSLKPPTGAKLFQFHGELEEIVREIRLTNSPFLHLNPTSAILDPPLVPVPAWSLHELLLYSTCLNVSYKYNGLQLTLWKCLNQFCL